MPGIISTGSSDLPQPIARKTRAYDPVRNSKMVMIKDSFSQGRGRDDELFPLLAAFGTLSRENGDGRNADYLKALNALIQYKKPIAIED